MEALAAVSLAGNLIQFIDFATSLVTKTSEVYWSASRTLKEHDDQKSIANDLKDLDSRLISRPSGAQADPVLEKLCSQCTAVAEELLDALNPLAIKGKCSKFQSFRKTLKVLWGKEKVLSIERSVAGFRQELVLHVTVDLRYCQTCPAELRSRGLMIHWQSSNRCFGRSTDRVIPSPR